MKLDRLTKDKLETRYTITAQQPKGHLNGFLLSYFLEFPTEVVEVEGVSHRVAKFTDLVEAEAWFTKLGNFLLSLAKTTVRVKYYDVQTAHVLYSNIPILYCIDKTDLEHGSSGYKSAQDLYTLFQNALLSGDTDTQKLSMAQQVLNSFGNKPLVSAYVKIGDINLQTGDTAEIEIVCNASQVLTNESSLIISSYSVESNSFHVLKVDQDKDKNELHNQVVETHLFDSANTSDFEFEVRGENDNYSSDRRSLVSLSSIFSNTENMNVERTYPVFKAIEGISEDVQVKVFETIDPIETISIINVRVESDYEKYLSQKQAQALNVQRLLNKATKTEVGKETIKVMVAENS